MLTYEALRDFVAKERNSQKLVELPDDFFREVRTYLEHKEKVSEGKEDLWELDNSKRMLQDILDSRETKIVRLALVFVRAGVTPGKILPEEREFFDGIVEVIRKFQEARKEVVEGAREEMRTVAFIEDVPAFVGVNMKEYGPFTRGEIARVPKDNSELLTGKGMAREIEGK